MVKHYFRKVVMWVRFPPSAPSWSEDRRFVHSRMTMLCEAKFRPRLISCMDANQFITEFTKWVREQKEIWAVLLVGSYARDSAKPDSDIDLVVITDEPEIYLDNDLWIKGFGEVKEIIKEDYKAVQVRRVFYGNGLEVEYGITTPDWAKVDPVDPGTERVIKDGAKILLDKNGILELLIKNLNKL